MVLESIMKISILFITLSLWLQWPNYTKKWNGSDLPGHSYAAFEDFNGKQGFKVKLQKSNRFYFKYLTNLKNGRLHLLLKSSKKIILDKDLSGSESDEFEIENAHGDQYKFIFTASHAEGSFDISYNNLPQ